MTVIGLLHPGEMGAAVGAAARLNGARVMWASEGRGDATRARARDAGLADAGSIARLVADSDLIFSICPPGAAIEVGREVAGLGFRGVYVDANAISPDTTVAVGDIVSAAGAQFVQTQYCFDVPMFRTFMQKARDLGHTEKVYILCGVGPLASAKTAKWIRSNVPGIHIPEEIIQRLEGAQDHQEQQAISQACVQLRVAEEPSDDAKIEWALIGARGRFSHARASALPRSRALSASAACSRAMRK